SHSHAAGTASDPRTPSATTPLGIVHVGYRRANRGGGEIDGPSPSQEGSRRERQSQHALRSDDRNWQGPGTLGSARGRVQGRAAWARPFELARGESTAPSRRSR